MEKIILVDSTSNFENIKNSFKKENNLSVISFDYKSHKKLENQNIPHQISDDYITDSQCKTCLLYTSPSPRDGLLSRMPSSA